MQNRESKTLLALLLVAVAARAQTAPNWTRQIPQNFPPERFGHAMAYDSVNGQVVLFGGSNGGDSDLLNDTWVWDGANWTQKSPPTSPPARYRHVMAYDSAHGQVVLFGGSNNGDTWVWDGSNWTEKSPTNSPPARLNAAMAYDSAHGQIVLFGGIDPNLNQLSDPWLGAASTWARQSPTTSPS